MKADRKIRSRVRAIAATVQIVFPRLEVCAKDMRLKIGGTKAILLTDATKRVRQGGSNDVAFCGRRFAESPNHVS